MDTYIDKKIEYIDSGNDEETMFVRKSYNKGNEEYDITYTLSYDNINMVLYKQELQDLKKMIDKILRHKFEEE